MAGRRRALIVANDRYDNPGLAQLLSPAADADALARVLGDERIGGFEVDVIRNEPAHVISGRVEDLFTEGRPDDVLLLHFSCHGLKNETGELFLAAAGTRPGRLGSTAVPADFVQRCMRSSRSRSIVLLLDCCYGGAFSQGVSVRAGGEVDVLQSFRGGGRGRAVITASSAMEYAFEGDRLAEDAEAAPSVFTAALVEGLETGDADRDEDGWVSLNELYDYVFDRVRDRNPRQTPGRDVEMQGELYLARSRRRRVRPQPIPADLRAAMTDSNMFSRLGAIGELRNRLASDNLPLAAGAAEALREIAAADIRSVAEAAREALTDIELTPSETEIHFVRPDESRVVQLLGPPLARSAPVEVSHDWLRAEEADGGLTITASPAAPGPHRGTVTVGAAIIAVHVGVDAPAVKSVPGAAAAPAPAVAPALATAPAAVPSPRMSLVAAALLIAAGMLAVILAGTLIAVRDDSSKVVAVVAAQLIVYAVLWAGLTFAGDRPGPHKVLPALLAAWAVFAAVTDANSDIFAVVWIVAGLLELAATIGRRAPTVILERLAGAQALLLGGFVLRAIVESDDSTVRYAAGIASIAVVWIAVGAARWPRPTRTG
jgi:Caspase domain